jgi:hypothetical protein
MSGSCIVPVNFPAPITNRPSLPRIRYRIGRYSDFRAKLLSLLDQSPLLSGWTHRQPDDPGIALLEGAAILGDILTFYQELYANEAWLGTAQWPESIAALVRLIGYRPTPGLGGQGYAAFEISGASPSTVPAGFPFPARIVGMSAPTNFETSRSIVALPSLSRFAMYAPSRVPGIYAGASAFGVEAADLATAGVTLKVNDRLMLVDDTNAANRQIAVVSKLATVLDQTVVTIAGAWQFGDLGGTMTAYKLGRTFRAFGYNAPATQFTLNSSNTLQSSEVDTTLALSSILEGFPLERQVDDLSAGITMLVDLEVTAFFGATSNSFSAYTALSVKSDTDSVGPMQGGITRVAFQPTPTGPPSGIYFVFETTDRRTAICYEVIGKGFPLAGVRATSAADTSKLDYWGDGASYQALDGRLLQFAALNPDDTAARVEEVTAAIDRTQIGDTSAVAVRRLTLTHTLTEFTLADFPFTNPSIAVFGNVVPVTQGRTQPVAVLGNGDARQVYQSFQLPKAPLTWLLDEALTPPRQPQLSILVNQTEWTQVDTLFASGAKDQVYILREDSTGNTWVQFGDGINAATLPSGVGNITATYRTGNAANGWRQSGAKPQPNASIANLANLRLYDEITGGTADEDSSHVRQSAPGRVEELGRIVSLEDFEYEALGLPGVEKALAVWDITDNVPVLQLTVLLSDDTPAQISKVQAAMSAANADRGANRFPVVVVEARLEYVYCTVIIGLVAGYQTNPVQASVAAALGVLPSDGSASPTGGLFSVDQRSLGQEEYASRIEGTIQNVEGVAWAQVTSLCSLGTATDPSTLTVPASPTLSPTLHCAANRVLALYAAHFSPLSGDA